MIWRNTECRCELRATEPGKLQRESLPKLPSEAVLKEGRLRLYSLQRGDQHGAEWLPWPDPERADYLAWWRP